jgi:hypothetical protein
MLIFDDDDDDECIAVKQIILQKLMSNIPFIGI